jgi:hypothetical protein
VQVVKNQEGNQLFIENNKGFSILTQKKRTKVESGLLSPEKIIVS